MNTKQCCRCKIEKPLNEFHKSKKHGSSPHCKECAKINYKKNKEDYIERARKQAFCFREWYTKIKSELVCEECGETRIHCLSFHHSDPKTKEKGIAALVNYNNKQRLLDEMKKCRVLCLNCHADLHFKLRNS